MAVLTFIFIAGDGSQIIQLPPRSTHVFRQSDCVAYTKRYFSDNSPILTPACYNLIGKDGRVASEFPILYFLSAKLCNLLGFHFWILRGLTLLCSIAGLVYLYLSVRIWINDTIIALFPVVLVVFIARWIFLQKFLRVFTAFLIVGAITYSLLWYKAFGVHDYYQLALVIPAIFLGVTILEYGERVLWEKLQRNSRLSAGFFLCCIMLAATIFTSKIQRQRYAGDNKGFANIDVLYEAEPYLRKMGVSGDDIVLTVPDGSPNISLSAFGNRGFTSDLFSEGRYNVKYCVARGARYMIILNEDYIDNPAYKPYTSKPVGRYKFIHVYDLR